MNNNEMKVIASKQIQVSGGWLEKSRSSGP
jgi:hypothetical protein